MVSFNELKIGDSAEVVGFHHDNVHVAKLQVLGLVPGTTLTVVRSAPLGDPVQVRVRGFNLGISRHSAASLMLQPI